MENSTITEPTPTEDNNESISPPVEQQPIGSGEADSEARQPLEQDESLTIDDFLNSSNRDVANKPVVEKKVEDNKTETPQPIIATPQVSTPAKLPSREEQIKELGISEPNEVLALKKMPNESFAYVINLLKSKKEFDTKENTYKQEKEALAAKLKETHHHTLYNHPQGYILTPEFNKLSAASSTANGVLNHWAEQLAKIRRGEKWSDLTANQQGQIVIADGDKEPDAQSEVYVMNEMTAAQQYAYQYGRQLEDLKTSHTTKRTNDEKFIKEQEEKFFPGYDKPEHETYKAQQQFRDMLPDTMKEYVPTSIFVKTVVNNALFARQVKGLQDELAKLKAAKPASIKPQPRTTLGAAQPSKGKATMEGEEVTIDDYRRIRNGGY